MNRDDIIRMAREAGLIRDDSTAARLLPGTELYPELNVFASLVAEHARNRTWTQAHWTDYERSIAAAERKRLHDKFMEMHKAQQHSNNYWHFAARKIMEESDAP